MTVTRTTATLVAVLILGALTVAGCSSSAPSSAKDTKRTTTTTSASGQTTTTRAPIDPSTVKGGQDAYVKAMVPMIEASSTLDAADAKAAATCLAPKWVKIIGVKGFAEKGIRPEDVPNMDGGLEQLDLTVRQAEAMAAGFAECKIDLRSAAVKQFTDDPSMPKDVKACIDRNITTDMVLKGLVANLSGKPAAQDLYAAPQKCLDDYQKQQQEQATTTGG